MNVIQYFKDNVYPFIPNNYVYSYKFKLQEIYLLNNPNIIEVDYIKSAHKNVPFSEIRWYIKCGMCKETCFYNWHYDPYTQDISIVNHNHIMQINGFDTLSDFYTKKFYKYCNNCSYPVYV